jgi:hypothetical protein
VTVEMGTEDIDLGVVSVETVKVAVMIERAPGDESVIAQVYIEEGTNEYWGQRMGVLEAPKGEGESYVISGVDAGRHTLKVRRGDTVLFRKEIEIAQGADNVEVLFKMPGGSASVRGRIKGDLERVALWNRDHRMRGSAVLGDDGSFEFANLSAGRYFLGNAADVGQEPFAELEAGGGQVEEIELDVSGFETGGWRRLAVKVFDANGIPCRGADAWIEVDGVEVEPYWKSDDGIFFIGGTGEYVLGVRCAGYKDVDEALVPETAVGTPETWTKLVRLEKADE